MLSRIYESIYRGVITSLLAIGIALSLHPLPVIAQESTPGLVAAYGFHEGSGGIAADSSSNANTGAISGATWTTQGKFGNALVFDNNTWVTVNDDGTSLDLSTGLTLEAWVYPTSTPTTWSTVLLKEQSNGLAYALYAGSPSNRPNGYVFTTTEQGIAGTQALPLNTWSYLATTYDGSVLRLYVNGAQVASKAVTGDILNSFGALRIGGNSVWGEYFHGMIDEVRVYNRALTQTEIQSDMSTPVAPPFPPPPPSQVGQWSGPFEWPFVPIHVILLSTGEVLAWDDHTDTPASQLWNPTTGAFTAVPYNNENLFCSGHIALPDGRILVVGGHSDAYVGFPAATTFNPAKENWVEVAPMFYARWYPTATTLPTGNVLVVSGATNCPTCNSPTGSHAGIARIPEIYNPITNAWKRLTNAPLSLPLYPHMFVLPDGRLFASSSQEEPIISRVLDLKTQTWTVVDPVAVDGGSAVMYLPGKIMKSGTGRNPDYPTASAAATTYVINMNQPSPAWRQTAPMALPRTQHNLTLLPDGTVLVTGGSRNSNVNDLGVAVHEAELWSPTTETYTTLAKMQTPRLYHSTALLLPDGRVLVGGGGHPGDFGVPQPSVEIYSPPYLFRGNRPRITAAPTSVPYGTSFFVQTPDASRIAKVSLVRLGSVTHAFNQEQRFLRLRFQPESGGLTVQGPSRAKLAPPGHYMLFIVDHQGVPSVATFVHLP